jgi:YbbR domain-containing protein
VRVVRVTPSEVRFKFEQPLTHRVPVRVRFANEGRNGYHVTGLTVQPAGLEIAGPQSRVERVHAVETDPVDVGLATGATEVRVNAYVDDPFVSFQSSSQVTVSFTMTKQ